MQRQVGRNEERKKERRQNMKGKGGYEVKKEKSREGFLLLLLSSTK